jgi:tetratricopeptide (TPR) repeat protein
MSSTTMVRNGRSDVPGAVVRALFRHPQALASALDDAGLEAHDLAVWARRARAGAEIEKLAGWLSVGQMPGRYEPLIEVAASHLRAGDLLEALPVFRWAYQVWRSVPAATAEHRHEGTKLLALWGECLYRLGQTVEAGERWQWALALVPDADTLARLARTAARTGVQEEYEALLAEAGRRHLPGAEALALSVDPIRRDHEDGDTNSLPEPELPAAESQVSDSRSAVAVMADVANLDMVCSDQYGPGQRLDYGRLLRLAGRHGPVEVKIAFVPDVPDTLAIRHHLAGAGFEIDLKRPKRSHGRIVANADTAMAAAAVRWAAVEQVERVELWTGDGDFLKVREVVGQAWPQVTVAFRSFEVGTAMAIRRLGEDWMAIGPEYLQV